MSPGQITAAIILWGSLFLIWHTYFGIYLYLLIAARFKNKKGSAGARLPDADKPSIELPTLTVLIPAYNEEGVIAAKLENILAQEYPRDRLEIVVASDLSTDRTGEIVRGYAGRGVKLIVMLERSGKNGIDDRLIPKAWGEVVAVTDANTMLEPGSLLKTAEHYLDPRVGAVCGNILVVPPRDSRNVEREVTYRRYELSIRRLMGRLGMVIGGIGGFYSLRRSLYRPIGTKPYHEDIVVLMEVLAQGYRVEFAEDGRATEETTESIAREFRHRIRLTSYTPSTLPRLLKLAWRAGPQALFLAFSYKVLRWLSPYLWLALFISALLLGNVAAVYGVIAGLFIFGLAMAATGWLLDLAGIKAGIATASYHFAAMNLASYFGLARWFKGMKPYWTPMER